MSAVYLLIPLISGLIGWGTNILAVRMLYHPREKLGIGPFSVQGVIPRRKAALAKDIAEAVQEEFLAEDVVREALSSPEMADSLVEVFEKQIDSFFLNTLGRNPLLANVFESEAVRSMKERHKAVMRRELPGIIEKVVTPVSAGISFQKQIEQKILNYDLSELEKLTHQVMGRELKEIERLGALIGFIIGLVQVLVFNFLSVTPV